MLKRASDIGQTLPIMSKPKHKPQPAPRIAVRIRRPLMVRIQRLADAEMTNFSDALRILVRRGLDSLETRDARSRNH